MTDRALSAVPEDGTPAGRTAFEVMNDVARGAVSVNLTEALRAVSQACIDTGKKGTVTLTMKIEPYEGDDLAVVLDASIKTNIPQPDMQSLFFVGNDGIPTRQDPRVTEMDV